MNDEEKYSKFNMTAKSFLPKGKYVDGDGETHELGDIPLKFKLDGTEEYSDLLAAVSTNGILKYCPLCFADVPKDATILVTNTHNIFPCWECNKLVEQPTDDNLEGLQ
jgi:hypothetical protein